MHALVSSSKVNPISQDGFLSMHRNEPTELMQDWDAEQLSEPSEHSSMSRNKEKQIIVFIKFNLKKLKNIMLTIIF